jgi:LmbE family N-acetylglucosaminyl deacetylase/folate-dependent phosphoribosylglycinamide formyltransferase PurN
MKILKNKNINNKKYILLLGHQNKSNLLINFLRKKGFKVILHGNKILTKSILKRKFDLIISFGYRRIIKEDIINYTKRPMINLHMSYLPYNRGSHPNFWSFANKTPKGISIHEIERKVDSGPIINRKIVNFGTLKNHTFVSTYKILHNELEKIFIKNFSKIINYKYKTKKQKQIGSFNRKNDLPLKMEWNKNIIEFFDDMKNLENKKKILIVAAHPDDEVLGCGGSIIKYKESHDIEVMFMTNGVSARGKNKIKALERKKHCLALFKYLELRKPSFLNFPDNQMDTIPLLRIVKNIENKIKVFKPEIIFTHFSDCLNIDHRRTYEAVITACRPIENLSVKKILSFEVLSSTEWALFKNKTFQPNYYINISKEIKKKISLMKFYKDELKDYPHSRSLKGIEALARSRGISSGVKFAEGFYLNRCLKD